MTFRRSAFIATLLALTAPAAPTLAQDKPKLEATGVYNCPISILNRCRVGRCETRLPDRSMEISIDFGAKTGCIRRGGGACRKPRSFRLVEDSGGYNMIFEKEAMIFRLNDTGELLGSDASRRYVVSFVARCTRG